MGFSEQILGWLKSNPVPVAGVAIEAHIQLTKADLATFASINELAKKLELRGILRMNLAGLIVAELESSRPAMATFYNRLTLGEFCPRERISQFRRCVYKGRFKALTVSFDQDLSTYLGTPDPSRPIAL